MSDNYLSFSDMRIYAEFFFLRGWISREKYAGILLGVEQLENTPQLKNIKWRKVDEANQRV